MKPSKQILLVLLSLAAGAILLLFWLHKQVTIIDGENRYPVSAFALTVQDALRSAHIALREGDQVSPPLSQGIKEGDTIRVERAAQVMILADRQITSVLTTERIPAVILQQAGVSLAPGDIILADGKAAPADEPLNLKPHGKMPALSIRRMSRVTIQEGSTTHIVTSTAATLGEALWEADIPIYASDRVVPSLDAPLESSPTAEIHRARQISIALQDAVHTAYTTATTVGEALADAGLPLQGLDYSLPPDTSPLPADGLIQIVKVAEEVLIEQTPIPFEIQYQPVEDLLIDQQKVVQAGIPGIQARRIRIRYENGVETSRQVEGEWAARQPQAQINGYGTKIVPQTLETPDGVITYWRAIQMYAVSYRPADTGSSVTASGMTLRKGLVAVDTRYIPFYTRLYIPGYGEAVAADRGGGVVGRIIDLGYSDHDYVPWHQNVTVYFLWPPPEKIVWIIP